MVPVRRMRSPPWKTKLTGLGALWQFNNRWQLLFNRVLFGNSGRLFYKIKNVEFLVDHSAGDCNGSRRCIASPVYKRFLPKMDLGSSVTLFDLGSNSGGFPLLLLVSGKRLAKVVCVEMNPNTFMRLEFNVRSNVTGEVHLVQGAVCGRRTELELALGPGSTSDSIYQTDNARPAGAVQKVQGYTFDDLFRCYFGAAVVDICKLDVEGAEYEILRSAECTQLARCRYLIVELHRASDAEKDEVLRKLSAMGFSEIALDDGGSAERLFRNEQLTTAIPKESEQSSAAAA